MPELKALNLSHLVGNSSLLKPYMSGYFVNQKLYEQARLIANPFIWEEERAKRVREKIEKERASRIRGTKKVKVNQKLADKLLKRQERRGELSIQRRASLAILVSASCSRTRSLWWTKTVTISRFSIRVPRSQRKKVTRTGMARQAAATPKKRTATPEPSEPSQKSKDGVDRACFFISIGRNPVQGYRLWVPGSKAWACWQVTAGCCWVKGMLHSCLNRRKLGHFHQLRRISAPGPDEVQAATPCGGSSQNNPATPIEELSNIIIHERGVQNGRVISFFIPR